MSTSPIWITEQDVVELMQLPNAIQALEKSMAAEYKGDAKNMNKTMLQYGKSNLHALGGQYGSLVGTKTWAHAESGTSPLLILWDEKNGQIAAIIEAFALGNLRTGATSGLATKWMSSPDASVMAIAGCGKQALPQVAAVAAVRAIKEVRVYSPTFEKSEAFAEKVSRELNINAVALKTMEETVNQADVITLATRATAPFLYSRFVKDGAHINAIGAIGPDREEFSQDIFERTGTICADALDSVKKLSREFTKQFEEQSWDSVQPIGQVIAEGKLAHDSSRISLFKAMGMGLSDVALGDAILKMALTAGMGRLIEQPQKSPIKLNANSAESN